MSLAPQTNYYHDYIIAFSDTKEREAKGRRGGGWRTQDINFASSQLTLSLMINHSFGLEKAGSSCDIRRRDKKMVELVYGGSLRLTVARC